MAKSKEKLVSGHLDTKHGLYYMILGLPNPEKGNRKLPKWFSTKIPCDGSRKNEIAAKQMLKEWREDFTSSKLTLAMIEDKKAQSSGETGTALRHIPIRCDMRFTDYLLKWLEIIRNDVEENTYAGYWSNVHTIIVPYFKENNPHLNELTSVEISLFYKHCKSRLRNGTPIKRTTIIHYHAVIHKALNDTVILFRILQFNPSDYAQKPKRDNYIAPYANTQELQTLVKELMNSTIRMPVVLAAFYGMRRSEALGIRKIAIDRKKKTITVSHTVIEVSLNGQHQIIHKDRTKSKKSFRTYPLIPEFEVFLDREMEIQAEQRRLLGNTYYYGDQDYICLNASGQLLRPSYVTAKFGELVKKHDLPKITFHGLRHSCASMLYEHGQDMKRIQEWLGHSTPVTTETIYAHLDIKHKDESAKIANSCLQLGLSAMDNNENPPKTA